MMKKEKLEQWILLQDTGELDPIRHWLLRRLLQSNPEARRFQEELDGLTRTISRVREDAGPHPFVLNNILEEARSQLSVKLDEGNESRPDAWAWVRPVLAVAAVVVIAVAAWFMVPRQSVAPQIANTPSTEEPSRSTAPAVNVEILSWDDGLDDDLASLELTLARADDWTTGDNGASSDSLDDMAQELLTLEGI